MITLTTKLYLSIHLTNYDKAILIYNRQLIYEGPDISINRLISKTLVYSEPQLVEIR